MSKSGIRHLTRPALGFLIASAAFELLLRHLTWTDRSGPVSVVYQRLREGWGVSRWLPDGARVAPPLAGPRLLVIGDSFTAAQEVNDDQVFTALLQQKLHVPVINAGYTSRSPADYVALADGFRQKFQPAWTVIQLEEWDLRDDSFNETKTHFVMRGTALVPEAPPEHRLGAVSRALASVRAKSALLNFLVARAGMFRSGANMPPLFRAADVAPLVKEQQRDFPVENELATMVAAYQGRVTFLLLPDFDDRPGATERRFLTYCPGAGVSCVDLRDAFAGFRERGRAPFGFFNGYFGVGHMNAEGHEAAAALLTRELQDVRRRGLF